MMPDEKAKLLALFEHRGTWCRGAEARDASGDPVQYDNQDAIAWDLTGALCLLFGWARARELFGQVERHVIGKPKRGFYYRRDPRVDSMVALQSFNDHEELTFERLRDFIDTMPTWHGPGHSYAPAAEGS